MLVTFTKVSMTFLMLEINVIFDGMVQLLNFSKLTWNFPYLKMTSFKLWRGQYILLIALHNKKNMSSTLTRLHT